MKRDGLIDRECPHWFYGDQRCRVPVCQCAFREQARVSPVEPPEPILQFFAYQLNKIAAR